MRNRFIFSFLCFGALFLHSVSVQAASITKEDACNLSDGLHSQSTLSITNYPGFTIDVGSFYKEKKTLLYVVDATEISGHSREAFLWSWDCTKKKAKQLSKYNFADYTKDEKISLASKGISGTMLDTLDPVRIEYVDKEHVFIRQNRSNKGEVGTSRFLVFYRSNKKIGEDFVLEKLNGFNKFKNTVLGKTVKIKCDLNTKSCYSNDYKEVSTPILSDGIFVIRKIATNTVGKPYLLVSYINRTYSNCLPTVDPSPVAECGSYFFSLPVNFEKGTIKFDPNFNGF